MSIYEQSKILPRYQIWLEAQIWLRGNLVGECLPQTLRVVASSISLALPKSAGLTHSSAPPFPHKVLWLCGEPLIKKPMYRIWCIGIFYFSTSVASSTFHVLLKRKQPQIIAQQSCHKFFVICAKQRNFEFMANFFRNHPEICLKNVRLVWGGIQNLDVVIYPKWEFTENFHLLPWCFPKKCTF